MLNKTVGYSILLCLFILIGCGAQKERLVNLSNEIKNLTLVPKQAKADR